MTRPGFRFTIGRLMGWVAAVAVALALWPLEIGPFALIFVALSGAAALLVRRRGLNWIRAAAWIFSTYPLLLVAFGVLSQIAGGWKVDNTVRLGSSFFFGIFPALGLSWGCTIAEWADATSGGQDRPRPVVGLILFALLPWFLMVFVGLLVPDLARHFLDCVDVRLD